MKTVSLLLVSLLLLPAIIYAGTINYVGSSTVGKFITDAEDVYKTSTFEINTKPESGGGEKCPAANTCDMGGVARDVNPEYLDKGVVATLIGKDAIAAIVNAKNPVKALRSDQLKGIFTGKITNWSQVGGPDMPIKAYIVKKGSATRTVFRKSVMGAEDYSGTTVITPDAKIVTMVSKEKGSIGQISFAFIKGKKGVKPLTVDGQLADVNNPSYPITRPLHIATKGAPTGDVKAFIDWALSPEGQKVVKGRFVGVE